MKFFVMLAFAFVFACGSPASPVAPGVFSPNGLKLVIGVERTKTITVESDGSVTNSETGHTVMKFAGSALQLSDGSKTFLTLEGDDLRGPTKTVGTFDGDVLTLGDSRISVRDNGVVNLTRNGDEKKMRMHFESSVVGQKRAAIMLVLIVFSLYVATNPAATIDRFVDD